MRALLGRMGKVFVATDLREDQTSSCTCSEASPFNCICPRADPPLIPTPIEAASHDTYVREWGNVARVSEPETSNLNPQEPLPPEPRPLAVYTGDAVARWFRMPDGTFVGVSEEFSNWAYGLSLSLVEVQSVIMEDYGEEFNEH